MAPTESQEQEAGTTFELVRCQYPAASSRHVQRFEYAEFGRRMRGGALDNAGIGQF